MEQQGYICQPYTIQDGDTLDTAGKSLIGIW